MATGSDTADAASLENVVMAVEGNPLPFELGGREWHIRQPTPAEMVRISMAYDVAYHRAWQEIDAEQLKPNDTASMVADAQRVGYWTAKHETETDPEERRAIAERIMQLRREDKSSAWDDIAIAYGLAERDLYALRLLLIDDDKDDLLTHPGAVRNARQYVQRVLTLANTVPNWTGRTAS